MLRDWKGFAKYWISALKGTAIGLILVPIFYVAFNPHPSDPQFLANMGVSVRIGLEVVIVHLLFSSLLFAGLYRWNPASLAKIRGSVQLRFAAGFIGMTLGLWAASKIETAIGGVDFNIQNITIGLLIGGVTYLAFVLRSAHRDSQDHNLKLRAESAEASMNVLKNQMQPHFLFNSLNSLAELIDSNRDFASQMTQKLSDLYREILESSKGQMGQLESEISIVRKYLELEALRFGPRLQYNIDVPAESILVPSLLLQTLVENSVKHGISQNLSGGQISLRITKKDGGYFVVVENTSAGLRQTEQNSGTGLANTKARLQLLYGDKHKFNILVGDRLTEVSFWITGV